jgi:hypothetical protein
MLQLTELLHTPSSDNLELVTVDGSNVGLHWPRMAAWIIKALERSSGRYTMADIYQAISTDMMVAFPVYNGDEVVAVCVAEIVTYPSKKSISIVIMVGQERNGWLHFIDDIESFGRERGCQMIEAWARPGWEKVLSDWDKTHILLEKNL